MRVVFIDSIGIFGFGQFGQFVAKLFKDKFNVLVTDKKDLKLEAKQIGVKFVSLKELASCKIIIVATPISTLNKSLLELKTVLKKDVLVIDVCSVKEKPIQLMKNILPKDTQILGTHPLFGPQSGKSNVLNLKIVLCPVRIPLKKLNKIISFLENFGLEVITMTPKEHDFQIARTQALTHFLSRALIDLGITNKEEIITTKTFENFLQGINLIKKDSIQLFKDIQNENPFAAKLRNDLITSLIKINKNLEDK